MSWAASTSSPIAPERLTPTCSRGCARVELDIPLWRRVSDWLASEWPFEQVDYAPRDA